MSRPAYLLSTVILAAVAAIQLQDMTSSMDSSPVTGFPIKAHSSSEHRGIPTAQTISNTEVSRPAQPQRWVF